MGAEPASMMGRAKAPRHPNGDPLRRLAADAVGDCQLFEARPWGVSADATQRAGRNGARSEEADEKDGERRADA